MDHKANVNAPAADSYGQTALQAAAEGGHEKVVQLLLDHKADVNAPATGCEGRAALYVAGQSGHEKMVRLLLDHNADVNAPATSWGRTALQAAAQRGHEKVVKLLLDHNVDLKATFSSSNDKTALQIAVEGGHVRVQVLLLRAGADFLGSESNKGQMFLHYACGPGRGHLLPRLLEVIGKQAFNTRDWSGSTPLHIAAKNHQPKAMELLIEKGANMEIQDTSGKTPLGVALELGLSVIIHLLLNKGASTDTIPTGKYLERLQRSSAAPNATVRDYRGCILISDDPEHGRTITTTSWAGQEITWDSPLLAARSILSLRPGSLSQHECLHPNSAVFGSPEIYLADLGCPAPGLVRPGPGSGPDPDPSCSVIRWQWSTWKQLLAPGIPNGQEILSLSPASGKLSPENVLPV